jgi:UDP-glucose:(heptosyl)LPS alpha-1,3-glucosyltransferase
MKIALIILHADIAKGGAERYTVDLANQLHARGHEVALVAGSFGQGIDDGVARVAIDASGASRLKRYQRFLDGVDAHLDATAYDVVHAMLPVRRCDVYHPHAGLAAESVRRGHLKHDSRFRRAGAWLANQLNPKRQAFFTVERRLLNQPHPPVVLSLSKYIQRTIHAHYPSLPEDRLQTLFNAVDLDRFNPERDVMARERQREALGLKHDDVVALFIGNDFRRKGLDEAIAAVGKANDPRLKIVVVGDDHAGGRAPGGAWIVRAGRVGDAYPFYACADFFILPTRHDPCSLVVLEALAMGVPVISTRFNGACEIMSPEQGFVLDDPTDVAALADAVRRLLDPVVRRAMSAACLSLRPRLSQEEHLQRLTDIYTAAAQWRRSAQTSAPVPSNG